MHGVSLTRVSRLPPNADKEAKEDPAFMAELARLRKDYVGGPTPLWFAERLTEHCGGARVVLASAAQPVLYLAPLRLPRGGPKTHISCRLSGAQIWLKREDLAHTGAHKINNALAQVMLAKRLGKPRVIAETGAGQHGVATATACALLGVQCVVYMGAEDCERQSLNVFRMRMLGAEVRAASPAQYHPPLLFGVAWAPRPMVGLLLLPRDSAPLPCSSLNLGLLLAHVSTATGGAGHTGSQNVEGRHQRGHA